MTAITSAEQLWYKSQVIADDTTNGGRINKAAQSVSGAENAAFPVATPAQMTAGVTVLRKLFAAIQSVSEDKVASAFRIWLKSPTAADDMVFLIEGTQRDTEASLSGSEDRFGVGTLTANESAGSSSIDVTVEDGSTIIFRDGEMLVLDDGTNRQFITINGAPSIAGDVVTIALDDTLDYTFLLGTPVASVVQIADLQVSVDNKTVTSSAGTFDLNEVTAHNGGAVEMDVTLTFTSATAFDATAIIGSSGDPISLGSGTVSAGLDWDNSDVGGADGFDIAPAAFGGTFATSDTVEFQVHPAAHPVWAERVIPAATAVLAGNEIRVITWAQTAV